MTSDHTRIAITSDPTKQRMSGYTAHGGLEFDVPFMSEVIPGLWQGGCTTSPPLILPTHIKHLVSLYPWERYRLTHVLKTELYVEAYDDVDQAIDQFDKLAGWVSGLYSEQSGDILVHCQAGLNRSSLLVGMTLDRIDFEHDNRSEGYVDFIREKRSPAALCNPAFESYLRTGFVTVNE